MKFIVAGFTNWLDHRTGYRRQLHEALYENVPGGSSWMYIWGSMLVFAFVTQAVTGVFLWMSYSAGSQNAWESVYYIQNELQGGWLLRGVHHYMAQAMVVLLPIHMLQVVLYRAYTGPREMNYWTGLVLMLLTLGLGLTGYLLPWDQKGYWATKVATELMSLPPGGEYIQKLVVGGSHYGHFTLTRFFAMHAGVLPALLIGVLFLHLTLFRRHGVTALPQKWRDDEYFWPAQVFKDAVGCLLLLGIVLFITVRNHGAELGPPAEPTEAYGAARPEWYYLFLFQLLKKFHNEFIGAIVVPGAIMAFLFALPFVARIKFGHVVNVVVLVILIVGAGYLTFEALYHDHYANRGYPDPDDPAARLLHLERVQSSEEFLEAQRLSEHEYERTRELVAFFGIPRQGAANSIVRDDPEIQGPRIFKRNCASCHSYLNPKGEGISGPRPPRDEQGIVIENPEPYGGPNLYGFASREWFRQILDPEAIASHAMFGATAHVDGDMVNFVKDELTDLSGEQKQTLEQIVIALSAEAQLVGQRDLDAQAAADGTIEQGRLAVTEAIDSQSCTDCHKFHDEGDLGYGPDLSDYGSYEWLYGFIANPAHERFYGDGNDRMPAFAENPHDPARNLLTHREMDLLVRWLRGDDKDLELAAQLRAQREAEAAEQAAADVESATQTATAEVEPAPTPAEPEPAPEPEPAIERTAGGKLFQSKCARCHAHVDSNGEGIAGPKPRESGSPNGAPNLYGFASREWLTGLLDPERIAGHDYFGNTKHADGDMVNFVQDTLAELDDEEQTELQQMVAALSAEASLVYQKEADEQAKEASEIERGRTALVETFACTDCHKFHDDGDLGAAPDLTGYGSAEWLRAFIGSPKHERFYPDTNDRMPSFENQLDDEQFGQLIRFLRREE